MGESSVLLNRGFQLFWIGQTLSNLGNAFTVVAFPLLVFRTTGSVAMMTAITACFAAGSILGAIPAGPIVDRFDRRRLLIVTDVGRTLLIAAIPLASRLHLLSVPLLGAIAVGMGALANLFGVGYVAFVAELVSKTRVTEANAHLQGANAVCFVAGPALAGLATEHLGPEAAIGADALSFIASFTLLLCIRGVRTAPVPSEHRKGGLVGLRFVLDTPVLRVLTVLFVIENFASAASLDLFTYFLKTSLRQSDSRVGVMFAIASVGAVVGAVVAPRAKRSVGMYWIFLVSAFVLFALMALTPLAGSFVVVATIAVAYTFNTTLRAVLSVSRRQEVTPDALLGRVTAAFWLALACARVVGAAVIGRAASDYGTSAAFRVVALLMLVLGVVAIPARALRETPR